MEVEVGVKISHLNRSNAPRRVLAISQCIFLDSNHRFR